ncbi:hypothetical protein NDU88_003507 [Pleurodeles waltl]|uniref:Uncharacterized protein n=1 Tax=Pleurodeles waltl TaxID=8319 RepID=A0AAV7MSN1_PLEWA|nr:hypothetical protein NDU88_003507 [Pleurodeles waltl]
MPFCMAPWTVIRQNGSSVVAQRGAVVVTRNISLFKNFYPPTNDAPYPSSPILSDDMESIPGDVGGDPYLPVSDVTGQTPVQEDVSCRDSSQSPVLGWSGATKYNLRSNAAPSKGCVIISLISDLCLMMCSVFSSFDFWRNVVFHTSDVTDIGTLPFLGVDGVKRFEGPRVFPPRCLRSHVVCPDVVRAGIKIKRRARRTASKRDGSARKAAAGIRSLFRHLGPQEA